MGSEVRDFQSNSLRFRLFFEWQKNIIISSLLGKKLIRIKYDYQSNKVLYLENIYLGQRIRDIIEINDGRIALLSDVLDANSFESVPKLIIIEKIKK